MNQLATISPRYLLAGLLTVALMLPLVVQAQVTRLAPDDAAAADFFGFRVSISDDGQRALVSAPLDDVVEGDIDQGSAYVFTRGEDGTWTQEAHLVADDLTATDTTFGEALALSGDGNRAILGNYLDEVNGNAAQGSAYIFTRNEDGTWSQEAKLTATAGLADDQFGRDVGIDGDGSRVVIGAWWRDVAANPDQGSAYIFTRNQDGTWTQEAEVTGSGTATAQWPNFGRTVDMDSAGETIAVGAFLDDVAEGQNLDEGRAYVFERSEAGTWMETAMLQADDGAQFDNLSLGLAISGDGSRVAAAAWLHDVDGNPDQGSVYVFGEDDDGTWSLEEEVSGSGSANSMFPNFGRGAVALDGDGSRLLVGAFLDDVTGDDSNDGRAYVFDRSDDGAWSEVAMLEAPTPTAGDQFGWSASISAEGDYALVGSRFSDDAAIGGNNDAGAAFVFGPNALPTAVTPIDVPRQFELSGVYPNPLADRGVVELAVPTTQQVTVSLYNTLGQSIGVIHDGVLAGGTAERIAFEVEGVPSGVYFVQVRGEGFTAHQKFVLAR